MQTHLDSTARVRSATAYGQPPGYELPPPSSALPYAPLPKRRGTGPTVLLVLLALAIPGLILGATGLVGGGSDSAGDASEAEGDASPADQVAMPTLEGAGYAYAVPEGWEDSTKWAHDVAPGEGDSAVTVVQPDDGFDTNVLVAVGPADGATSVEQARETWLPADDGSVESLEPTTIDGVDAVGVRHVTRNDVGRRIVQVGYLALWDERLYSIVLSAPVESERDSQAAFDAVLDSWSWADSETPYATA